MTVIGTGPNGLHQVRLGCMHTPSMEEFTTVTVYMKTGAATVEGEFTIIAAELFIKELEDSIKIVREDR